MEHLVCLFILQPLRFRCSLEGFSAMSVVIQSQALGFPFSKMGAEEDHSHLSSTLAMLVLSVLLLRGLSGLLCDMLKIVRALRFRKQTKDIEVQTMDPEWMLQVPAYILFNEKKSGVPP